MDNFKKNPDQQGQNHHKPRILTMSRFTYTFLVLISIGTIIPSINAGLAPPSIWIHEVADTSITVKWRQVVSVPSTSSSLSSSTRTDLDLITTHYILFYKAETQHEWMEVKIPAHGQVGSHGHSAGSTGMFTLRNLKPSTSYELYMQSWSSMSYLRSKSSEILIVKTLEPGSSPTSSSSVLMSSNGAVAPGQQGFNWFSSIVVIPVCIALIIIAIAIAVAYYMIKVEELKTVQHHRAHIMAATLGRSPVKSANSQFHYIPNVAGPSGGPPPIPPFSPDQSGISGPMHPMNQSGSSSGGANISFNSSSGSQSTFVGSNHSGPGGAASASSILQPTVVGSLAPPQSHGPNASFTSFNSSSFVSGSGAPSGAGSAQSIHQAPHGRPSRQSLVSESDSSLFIQFTDSASDSKSKSLAAPGGSLFRPGAPSNNWQPNSSDVIHEESETGSSLYATLPHLNHLNEQLTSIDGDFNLISSNPSGQNANPSQRNQQPSSSQAHYMNHPPHPPQIPLPPIPTSAAAQHQQQLQQQQHHHHHHLGANQQIFQAEIHARNISPNPSGGNSTATSISSATSKPSFV